MSEQEFAVLNKSEEVIVLDMATLCGDPPEVNGSAIDMYYETAESLIKRTLDAQVADDTILLRLFLLELISAAEYYFRSILAALPSVCRASGSLIEKSMMMLGAVSYYGPTQLAFGVFEHASLSGKGEVVKYTRDLAGFNIHKESSVGVALAEFERVCQLRHAIVHAQGRLWYKNICELGLPQSKPRCVCLTALGFQGCVARTHNAVRAYNAFVGNRVIGTWASSKLLTGKWSDDRALVEAFHGLFYSKKDGSGEADPRSLHARLCKQLKLA